MGDRYNIHSQLEHLQSKYIGTGHADTSRWEWLSNQHRDSYASYVGHFDLLNFIALAENETKARVRFNFMEKMLQPCGPPVDKVEDWVVLHNKLYNNPQHCSFILPMVLIWDIFGIFVTLTHYLYTKKRGEGWNSGQAEI